MAFFGLFKKKDDFDSLIKNPISDPFKDSDQPGQLPYQNNPVPQDIPGFDMPDMPKDETAMNNMNNNLPPFSQNNYNTSANSFQNFQGYPQGGMESSPPPRRDKPEVYEEMLQQRPQNVQRTSEAIDKRDIELISSKLDAIKSQLESVSSRLANLERKQFDEEPPRQRRYNW